MKDKRCKHCDADWHTSFKCFYRPQKESKPCEHCESKNHLSWQCFKNPKRKEQIQKKLKNDSRSTVKWTYTRKEWFKQHPAESYNCFYCARFLLPNQTTLDHYHSRSRHPELRYELSNLVPCCFRCNMQKGSIDGDDFVKKIQKTKGERDESNQ